ncbi:hypothetical protein H5410_046242 [Solanum commersonii]|uniref:Uncharacterized protein n=1 Tax=Solanum commersonii TaxID=4109 RepID=A0A9J5XFY8_SOLCO|nr:hypothetical protein H5410_046242 [Solanum commersonii]
MSLDFLILIFIDWISDRKVLDKLLSHQCIQKTWLLLNTVAKKLTSRYYTEKYAEKFKLGTTIWKYAGSVLKDVNFSYLPGTIS